MHAHFYNSAPKKRKIQPCCATLQCKVLLTRPYRMQSELKTRWQETFPEPLTHRNVRKSSVATFLSGNRHLGVKDDDRGFTSGVEHEGLTLLEANFLCARICHKLTTFTNRLVTGVHYWQLMKKALRETQTLCAGCSKAEPKISPRCRPLPGGAGRPKLIWFKIKTKFNHTDPVWWKLMHAISSYRSNRPTNTPIHKQTNPQTGPITIHCATIASVQCNKRAKTKTRGCINMHH